MDAAAPLPLLPGLPDDLALICLVHVPWQCQGRLLLACKRWCHLLVSGELASVRQDTGKTEQLLGISYMSIRLGSPYHEFQVFNPKLVKAGTVVSPRVLPVLSGVGCHLADGHGLVLVVDDASAPMPANIVWKYDCIGNSWSSTRIKDHPLVCGAGLLEDGSVVVVGHYCEQDYAVRFGTRVILLNSSMTSQEALPDLNVERWRCTVLEVGGEVWVVPGLGNHGNDDAVSLVEVFSKGRSNWERLDAPCSLTPGQWLVRGKRLYRVSNLLEGDLTTRVAWFDTETKTGGDTKLLFAANEGLHLKGVGLASLKDGFYSVAVWGDEAYRFCDMTTWYLLPGLKDL